MGQLDKLLKDCAHETLQEFERLWSQFQEKRGTTFWNEESIALCNALPLEKLRAWKAKHAPDFTGGINDYATVTDKKSSYYLLVGQVISANEEYCVLRFTGRTHSEFSRRNLRVVT